jgi:hypothetical protein
MTRVTIDAATGVLKIAGKSVFPIGLSNPPPIGKRAPSGKFGLQELAAAGATFIRTGGEVWSGEFLEGQIANERKLQDAAADHGLRCWLRLGNLGDLPERKAGQPPSLTEQLLARLVGAFKAHPGLLAYKGVDEPRNPFRGENWVRPAGLVRAYQRVKALDPDHPVVIIQAPRSPVSQLVPYRNAFDITGVDIYPVGYPPGTHSDSDNKEISVVGEMARKMRQAAGGKPVWMTLQIAWSGTSPTKTNPDRVPRWPTLHQQRFMTYQAIVNGARGVNYFGGHLTQLTTPADAEAGWNWTFWERTLRPVVRELASADLAPALVAPNEQQSVKTRGGNPDIELVTRRTARYLYVIAVRRGGPTSVVHFVGLPPRKDGKPITFGRALFEYTQQPPPPPIEPGHQAHRRVEVKDGTFHDWFAPNDVHVYRFAL